jgi:transposase-like protein
MSHKSSKTAEEKLVIVLEGLKGGTTVGDLCRKYGLSQEDR